MRIYLPEAIHPDKPFTLGRDFKKRLIRVMRLKPGDSIEVFTPGHRWICRLSQVLPDAVQLEPQQELPAAPTPRLKICLGQALMRGEKFDWVVQKATELGATEIIPLLTQRTVVKALHIENRWERWNEIAEQAAGQSENSYPPAIHFPERISDFLKRNPESLRLILHERIGALPLKQALLKDNVDSITFVVGPEGGWAPEELQAFESAGFLRDRKSTRLNSSH